MRINPNLTRQIDYERYHALARDERRRAIAAFGHALRRQWTRLIGKPSHRVFETRMAARHGRSSALVG